MYVTSRRVSGAMLARIALQRKFAAACASNVRCSSNIGPVWEREVLTVKEDPERDVKNFPRYKLPVYSGPVRLGFIPEEWFLFFYPKTGRTGPYLFGTGLVTYLLSKEIWVVEHEFYSGAAFFSLLYLIQKLYGKDIGEGIDKLVEQQNKELIDSYNDQPKQLQAALDENETIKVITEVTPIVYDAKKEMVKFQLEAEFRKRQVKVYEEVKKRLDYHLETINIERRLQQKHMVDWIVSNVYKSITPQQEKDALSKCIADLKTLAAKA